MAIDNDMYSREDYGWWSDDANNTCVLLRYFINPIRFAYVMKWAHASDLRETTRLTSPTWDFRLSNSQQWRGTLLDPFGTDL